MTPQVENRSFDAFGLSEPLLRAVREIGYEKPTPIQVSAIPKVLSGADIMGAAQTGTGKTAGFALPVLENLRVFESSSASPARHPVRALILAPTRELAMQNEENIRAYAKYTKLRVAVVYGGVDMREQAETLRAGVEVLIATPGRLLDLVEQKIVTLSQAAIVVLDEADRMLDMGFLPDISRILKLLPVKRQSLMFSATFSPEIKSLAAGFLNSPEIVEVARQNSVATTIEQHFYAVNEFAKVKTLEALLKKEYAAYRPVLIFVNAKITARRLSRFLENDGFEAESIHGDKSQDERTKTLEAFKGGKVLYLVATDVAARGLDISDLPLVINFDVPFNPEDYVHRIGRTGRAGQKGRAVTLVATEDDKHNIAAIEGLTKHHCELEAYKAAASEARTHQRAPRRAVAPAPEIPQDPFFDRPYEASGKVAPAPAPRAAAKSGKTKPLAALLTGFRDEES